jgi:hypothetical protein
VVPATPQVGYDGSSTTSTADLVASGDVLLMTFEGLTEALAKSVLDHQSSQRGKSFGFNSATLATALTPAGFQWTYARPVSQDDIYAVAGSEFYRLAVEFVGVWIRRASTPSATARIELRTTAARALPAGTPSATATLLLTTTAAGMATGTPSQSAFLMLRTTPANVRVPTGEDFYWPEVLFLCGFNGTNGSQSFVDEGPLGLTLSAVGDAEISTTWSAFGGSSLKLNQPNNDSPQSSVRLPLDRTILITGDYTLDVRCRFSSLRNHSILGKIATGANTQMGIDNGSGNHIYHIYGGQGNLQAYEPLYNISVNTPIALRYARKLNAEGTSFIYYTFVNGTLIMARASGDLEVLDITGANIGWASSFAKLDGYIDEMRLTAACRSTDSYTVDTAPFPRS